MADERRSVGVRVRPNSHDFIRDLRAQLSGKRYTFTVDVKANTNPATKDVRAWASGELKKVSAVVNVGANTGKATRDVAQWRERQRNAAAVNVKVGADLSQANRDVMVWREAMGRVLEIKVKADVSGRGIESIRRAVGKNVRLGVDADMDAAERKIKEFSNQPGLFEIEVDAKTKKAKAKVREFFEDVQGEQATLDLGADVDKAVRARDQFVADTKKMSVSQELDLDTKKARNELARLKLQAFKDKINVDVDIDTRKITSFSDTLAEIERMTGNLTVIRSLDLGPLTLGKPTGLIGTIATITTLAGLVPGAVTGISALSDALVRLAGAASIVPGAIAAIGTSIATLSFGTQGVGDAFGAMFDMWKEGASEQASSASNLVSAHNNYRNAVVDEGRAQKDVARARREALHDLRDLNNELRGGVLNEAQALLDLQKARDRMAQGGFETQTDYLQARLDVQRAELGVAETREDNIKLQEKANDANAQGVEGSDKVTQALEAQTRAAQQTAAAAAALSEAQASGTDATSKFNDMLGQLSPNARDFVETFAGLKGQIGDFRNAIQDTIFQGAGPGFLEMFNNLMPVIGPGMQQIAQGLNQNLLQVFDTLESPDGKSIIERILGGTAESQQALTKLIDPLVTGLGTLVAAGTEHLPQVIDLMTQLATRFSEFITKADEDGTLDKFMDEGIDALSDIAEILINGTKIMNDFSEAFRGAFGEDLLSMIARLSGDFHNFLNTAEGQDKINEYLNTAKEIWEDWKPVLEDLPEIFQQVSDAAVSVLKLILAAINPITEALEHMPWLVETIAAMWLGSKVLGAVLKIKEMATFIGSIATGLGSIASRMTGINWDVITSGGPPGTGTPPVAGGLPDADKPKPGSPGVPPVAAGPASLLAPAATIAAPLYLGSEISNALLGQDLPLAQQIGLGFKQPVRTFQDIFSGGSDVTQIDEINKRIEGKRVDGQDIPKYEPEGHDAAQALIGSLVAKGSKAGVWVSQAENNVDQARRYAWLFSQDNASQLVNDPNFTPPGSYQSGGYTDWGIKTGRMAELHGGEWVQPHPAVAHYGKEAMQAVQDRRAAISYEGGGPANTVYDPQTGQYVTVGTPVSHGTNPEAGGGGWLGAIATGVQGAVGAASNVASQVPGVGTGPAPGPATPGVGTGPLPGPAAPTPTSTMANSFLGALGIPMPGQQQNVSNEPGWGSGGAPVGLGGGPPGPNGEMPFDIRNFGIGPGPPGSGPNQWMAFTGDLLGSFGANMFKAFAQGALDMFGLGGITNSPYFQAATGIAGHIAESPGFSGKGIQDPNAAATNAQVNDLLNTSASMPGNPAYPGVPNLPGVFDPSTGSGIGQSVLKGLQVNTSRGEAIIRQNFPWATNIGGVRPDGKKWHPNGLALDVMTDPGLGNNSSTPAGLAKGDQLYAWLKANQQKLGIDYIMWREPDHWNHLHVNFAPSGYGPGGGPPAGLTAPSTASTGPVPGDPIDPNDPNADVIAQARREGRQSFIDRGLPIPPAYQLPGDKPKAPPSLITPTPRTPRAQAPSSGNSVLDKLLMPPGFFDGGMVPFANPNDQTWQPSGPGADQFYVPAYRNGRRVPHVGGSAGSGKVLAPRPIPGNPNGITDPLMPSGGWGPGLIPAPGQGGFDRIPGRKNKVMDRGGWIGPGTTVVHNYTGHPELVVPTYARGGYFPPPMGLVTPPRPLPRGPEAKTITTTPPPRPQVPTPSQPVGPSAPPLAPPPPPPDVAAPPPTVGPAAPQGPSPAQVQIGSARPATGAPPSESGDHVHPALRKGITSGFATAGKLAGAAASMGMGAMGGGMGGGLAGGFIEGLFGQAGKIANNVANVASSFLVGNLTGGTTANPYGVTQRGNVPSGGSRVVDASTNQFGDIYTNNLDEWKAMQDRRENQRAQSSLGQWADR